MSVYPQLTARSLADLTQDPEIAEANGIGAAANLRCGCFVRFHFGIDKESGIVESARFNSNGCGYMLTAAAYFVRNLKNRKLTELRGLTDGFFASGFDADFLYVESGRKDCVDTAREAVRAAFLDHRDRSIENATFGTALICTCFGVSERSIKQLIREFRPESVDEIVAQGRAGSGCGSCRSIIQEVLDSTEF